MVYKSDQLDLQAAGQQVRECEWHDKLQVGLSPQLAHVQISEAEVLSQVMRQHGRATCT